MGFWNGCVELMADLGKATGATVQGTKKAWETTEKFTVSAWNDAAQAWKQGRTAFETEMNKQTVNPKTEKTE